MPFTAPKSATQLFATMKEGTHLRTCCRDAAVEPLLEPLDGEKFDRNSTAADDARLDIKVNGLCRTVFGRTFFEVKIFNTLAKSCPKTIRDSHIPRRTQKTQIWTKDQRRREQHFQPPRVFVNWRRRSFGEWSHETTGPENLRGQGRKILRCDVLHSDENKFCTTEELHSMY